MDFDFSNLTDGQKIYMASDFHLGAPTAELSLEREKKIIRWLNSVQTDAHTIILVGDIFDFWFEYKHVIPKGFTRFMGKLLELKDEGIEIIMFTGNHDLWMKDYFPEEFGIPVIHEPVSVQIGKNLFHIAHGDGLGPGDHKFKFFKKIFTNKLAQWAFRWLHPDAGIALAKKWSQHSKDTSIAPELNGESEWLITYCNETEQKQHHDFYVMGHRHLSLAEPIGDNSIYYNLGEWIDKCTYLEVTNETVKLHTFEN